MSRAFHRDSDAVVTCQNTSISVSVYIVNFYHVNPCVCGATKTQGESLCSGESMHDISSTLQWLPCNVSCLGLW